MFAVALDMLEAELGDEARMIQEQGVRGELAVLVFTERLFVWVWGEYDRSTVHCKVHRVLGVSAFICALSYRQFIEGEILVHYPRSMINDVHMSDIKSKLIASASIYLSYLFNARSPQLDNLLPVYKTWGTREGLTSLALSHTHLLFLSLARSAERLGGEG